MRPLGFRLGEKEKGSCSMTNYQRDIFAKPSTYPEALDFNQSPRTCDEPRQNKNLHHSNHCLTASKFSQTSIIMSNVLLFMVYNRGLTTTHKHSNLTTKTKAPPLLLITLSSPLTCPQGRLPKTVLTFKSVL